MTKKTKQTPAQTADLAYYRAQIDGHLAALDGVTILNKHHRALLGHVRVARRDWTNGSHLRKVAECADELTVVYTRRDGRSIPYHLAKLAERPNKPFTPPVDLPASGSAFGGMFRM